MKGFYNCLKGNQYKQDKRCKAQTLNTYLFNTGLRGELSLSERTSYPSHFMNKYSFDTPGIEYHYLELGFIICSYSKRCIALIKHTTRSAQYSIDKLKSATMTFLAFQLLWLIWSFVTIFASTQCWLFKKNCSFWQ